MFRMCSTGHQPHWYAFQAEYAVAAAPASHSAAWLPTSSSYYSLPACLQRQEVACRSSSEIAACLPTHLLLPA